MRNTPNYGLMAAALLIAKSDSQRKRAKAAPKKPRELTEVEKWNAEVEAKKAAKKARRAASKETKRLTTRTTCSNGAGWTTKGEG